MEINFQELQTPCQINLELTSACNHKCRYCYNAWRHEAQAQNVNMPLDKLDRLIDDIIACRVFNVILTGGEPFVNYPGLLRATRRLTEAGILVTCNSNLTLATAAQLIELKAAGLPHILTSLSSFDPEVNDAVFGSPGAFVKVAQNIRFATSFGIKVSVNNILHYTNKGHTYRTGLLVAALGAGNFFINRASGATDCAAALPPEFTLTPEDYRRAIDDAVRVKQDTGIAVSSLSQFPVCFLRDPVKYADFLGRVCPCGTKMMSINADGTLHACNHEVSSYGNVFETGLKPAWDKMKIWRDGSLIPAYCQKCKWFPWCRSGCRQCTTDGIARPDYLWQGKTDQMPDPVPEHAAALPLVTETAAFHVKKNIRFRPENNFWLFHTVGSWITQAPAATGAFLADRHASGTTFMLGDFPGSPDLLAHLIAKQIVGVAGQNQPADAKQEMVAAF